MDQMICDFLKAVDDLQHVVNHETMLLREGKAAEAIQLFGLKEATIRTQTELQEKIASVDGFASLTSDQLQEITDVMMQIKQDLLENQRALDSAYRAHQTLIHLCVEAVKAARETPRLYDEHGGLKNPLHNFDSIAINRRL